MKKHPEIIRQYEKAFKLLEINPQHPSLHLHSLAGKQQALHSVSINISYRTTLELFFMERDILLINVGSHEDVY